MGTFASVLSYAAVRRSLSAYALVSASVGVGAVVMSVALFERGGSAGWAAVGAVARVLPFILLSAISGVVADRHDTRRVLVLAYAAQGVAAAALALAVAQAPLAVVAVVGLLGHAAWTISYPTVAGQMPRLLDSEDLAAGNGLLSTVESLAWIAGPGLGGLLVTSFGYQWASAVQGVLAVSGLALLGRVGSRGDAPPVAGHTTTDHDPSTPLHRRHVLASLWAVAGSLVRSPALVVPLVLLLVANLVYGSTQVLLLVAATGRLGMSDGGYGALNAALGVGAFGALLLVNRAARSRRPAAVTGACVLLTGVPLAALAIVAEPPIAILLLFGSGLGMVLTEVLALTTMQRNVAAETIASVVGILDSLTVASILVGSAIAAPLVRAVGLEAALALVGGLVPMMAVIGMPYLAHRRERGAVDLAPLAPTVELLAGLPVLRHASRTSVEAIAVASARLDVRVGDVLIRQGDSADAFYAVVDGSFDIVVRGADGTEELVATATAGGGFGEIGLLHGVPRQATVTAAADGTVVRVPKEAFLQAVGAGEVSGGTGVGAAVRDYVVAG